MVSKIDIVERYMRETYKRACPVCGSWNLKPQMPIDVDMEDPTDPKAVLKAWVRATKSGHTPLKGPCYIMCFDCFHKGPSVDCTGRTSEDVSKDKDVFTEMKRLWAEHDYKNSEEEV